MSLNCIANENSYFTNYAWRDKDSYLVTTADLNEQCYYGRFSDRNYRCCDFDFTYDSRFCYETLIRTRARRALFPSKLKDAVKTISVTTCEIATTVFFPRTNGINLIAYLIKKFRRMNLKKLRSR